VDSRHNLYVKNTRKSSRYIPKGEQEQVVAEDYSKYFTIVPKKYSPGNNIASYKAGDLNLLSQKCFENKDCLGFQTDGTLKSTLGDPSSYMDSRHNLYVKNGRRSSRYIPEPERRPERRPERQPEQIVPDPESDAFVAFPGKTLVFKNSTALPYFSSRTLESTKSAIISGLSYRPDTIGFTAPTVINPAFAGFWQVVGNSPFYSSEFPVYFNSSPSPQETTYLLKSYIGNNDIPSLEIFIEYSNSSFRNGIVVKKLPLDVNYQKLAQVYCSANPNCVGYDMSSGEIFAMPQNEAIIVNLSCCSKRIMIKKSLLDQNKVVLDSMNATIKTPVYNTCFQPGTNNGLIYDDTNNCDASWKFSFGNILSNNGCLAANMDYSQDENKVNTLGNCYDYQNAHDNNYRTRWAVSDGVVKLKRKEPSDPYTEYCLAFKIDKENKERGLPEKRFLTVKKCDANDNSQKWSGIEKWNNLM
jgi:hypothetical protein